MSNLMQRFQTFVNRLSDRYEPYMREILFKVYMVLDSIDQLWATTEDALIEMTDFLILTVDNLVRFYMYYKDAIKGFDTLLSMIYALNVCSGMDLGPLLGYVCSINPAIILLLLLLALAGTFATFVALSLAALLDKQFKTMVCILTLLSVFNMVSKSYFTHVTAVCGYGFMIAAFIVYDTQNIVVKCRNGNRYMVKHAMDLIVDVLGVIILTQVEYQNGFEDLRTIICLKI